MWAYLEEVSAGSSYPDIWLAGASQAAMPREPLIYTLRYGNQGGAPAARVWITSSLPAGLTFVNAHPAPVATTPTLRWQVGDLAAHSGPLSIVVTTTHTLPVGTAIEVSAVIGTQTDELEVINNTSQHRLWAGRVWYLPILLARNPWP
jgi:uncharacterized repeat protein (TIGR01451 family)